MDIGARSAQFLIVFSGGRRGFLRRGVGQFARTAHGIRACVNDAEDRLEHQRVEQESAQQQEANHPKRCDVWR